MSMIIEGTTQAFFHYQGGAKIEASDITFSSHAEGMLKLCIHLPKGETLMGVRSVFIELPFLRRRLTIDLDESKPELLNDPMCRYVIDYVLEFTFMAGATTHQRS